MRHKHKQKQSLTGIDRQPSQDRYLITYADLLTLLFALFVILYAISNPDKEKMEEMFKAFNNIFNPNQVIEENNKSSKSNSKKNPPVILYPSKPLTVEEIYDKLTTNLGNLINSKKIRFERTSEGIRITMPDKFLFQTGKTTLIDGGETMLDTIANNLQGLDDMQIQIDGHTDNKPIENSTFKSNWQLSAARATSVLEELVNRGVPSYNLVIRAFGDQRPVANNDSEEGQAKNRRVEIIIAPKEEANATKINDSRY